MLGINVELRVLSYGFYPRGGGEAATALIRSYDSGTPVEEHLADQIVLCVSLCEEESEFIVSSVSQHLLTNLWVIGRFRKFSCSVDGELGKAGRVRINQR
jgi:RNA 3'-terminal phosphate cyclase (ATP)